MSVSLMGIHDTTQKSTDMSTAAWNNEDSFIESLKEKVKEYLPITTPLALPLEQILSKLDGASLLKVAVSQKGLIEACEHLFKTHCEQYKVPKLNENHPFYLTFAKFYVDNTPSGPEKIKWEEELKTMNARFVVKVKTDIRNRTMLKTILIDVPAVENVPLMEKRGGNKVVKSRAITKQPTGNDENKKKKSGKSKMGWLWEKCMKYTHARR